MAEEKLKLILNGEDNASDEVQKVNDALSKTGEQAKKATPEFEKFNEETEKGGKSGETFFKNFIKVAGTLGTVKAAAAITKKAFDLAEEGKSIENAEARLAAFAGGVENANDVISELQRSLEGSITKFDAAKQGAQLFELGLVKTADEAGELSRAIVSTGGDIDDFSLMIGNTSYQRLDRYGLSVSKVKEQMGELKEANASLSDQEAFGIAVRDQLITKTEALSDAGYDAFTSYEKLRAATGDLTNEFKVWLNEALDPAIEGLYLLITYQDQVDKMLEEGSETVAKSADNYDEYASKMISAAKEAKKLNEQQWNDVQAWQQSGLALEDYLATSGELPFVFEQLIEDLGFLTEYQWDHLAATEKSIEVLPQYSRSYEMAQGNVAAFGETVEKTSGFIEISNKSLVSHNALIKSLNGSLGEEIANLEELRDKYEIMSAANQNYTGSFQVLNQEVRNINPELVKLINNNEDISFIYDKLTEDQKVIVDQYEDVRLGMYNTSAASEDLAEQISEAEQAMRRMIGEAGVMTLLESGLEGSSAAAYTMAYNMGLMDEATYNSQLTLEGINDYLSDTEDVTGYAAQVEWLADNLDRLSDREYTVTEIKQTIYRETIQEDFSSYANENDYYSSGGGQGDIPGYATGGSFVVGGNGGVDSQYISFMATPGETVTISTPGQNGGNGATVNNYFTINGSQNPQAVAREVAKLLKGQGVHVL